MTPEKPTPSHCHTALRTLGGTLFRVAPVTAMVFGRGTVQEVGAILFIAGMIAPSAVATRRIVRNIIPRKKQTNV